MGPRLETVYRQMRAEAVPDTDLTEGLEEAKAPASKSKDENEAEDLGPAVVSPDDKDSGPSKAADKMKKTTKATKESVVDEDDEVASLDDLLDGIEENDKGNKRKCRGRR